MPDLQTNDLEEVRRRLGLFFAQNQAMVDRYIQLHGTKINMKAIQDVRDEIETMPNLAPITQELASTPNYAGLDLPYFTVEVDCPCCSQKGIPHRELRASAMAQKNDPFLAPVYTPLAKFQPLNFLMVNVTVCPRCLLASPDKKDFIQFNRTTRQTVPSQLSSGIIAEIQDSIAERQEMLERAHIKPEFQLCPRSSDVAILSYQLADHRARIEAESKHQFSIFKRANYHTRIALLQRQAGIDDTATLQKALTLFKEAYYRTDFPNANAEFQSCFLIFSIFLRFNQLKEAREYISVMEQSKKDVEARKDPAAVQALNTWLGMTKARWDDRDNPRLWETPS